MADERKPLDYGIKLSQPFYDVLSAGDQNLIFSSAWLSIATAYEKVVDIPAFGSSVLEHGLGFPPFAFATVLQNGKTFNDQLLYPDVTKNRLYLSNFNATDIKLAVRAYNVHLDVDVEYPYIQPPGQNTPYDPDFGIKIAKQGKKITSTDLRDFILHSRCSAPMVLAVKTEKSISNYTLSDGVTVANNALYFKNPGNYVGWAYGYASFGNDDFGDVRYTSAVQYGQALPSIFYDGSTPYLQLPTANDKGALIVLRDPLFAPNTVEVTY